MNISHRNRRCGISALALLLIAAAGPLLADGETQAAPGKPRVIVLGVDGLDPKLLDRFVAEGVLPNLQQMIKQGDYGELQTSMPPLSPVAWSNFITGMDPGGHGIFDFIHRDPATKLPTFSMAKTLPAKSVTLGGCVFPYSGGGYENLRKGTAFWEILEDHGVSTKIFRMPVNFPPTETSGYAFSGMGTPDVTGSPGTFSFYTNRKIPHAGDISGGDVYGVRVLDNVVNSKLHGPENPFWRVPRPTRRGDLRYEHPDMQVEFQVYLDPDEAVVKISVQDQDIVLQQGEWSDWVRVDFDAECAPFGKTTVPLFQTVSSTARFYLKQVRPDFELYVTPLQINPESPVMPISTPDSWSKELYEQLGYFYTQNLPADTKAFQEGVFTGREFFHQSQLVYHERRKALDYLIESFDEDFLFFYFTSIDQGCHMLWHFVDPQHPGFEEDEQLIGGIRQLYVQLDAAVGHVLGAVDDNTTLVIMSDHGFNPFYWEFNLNTWLMESGYVTLRDPLAQGRSRLFANVDWPKTKAYAVGLNGLYVNMIGREDSGAVSPGQEYETLLDQLEQDLLAIRDPRNGQQVVTLVVRPQRDFHGDQMQHGPDIIVGYNYGYRSSWKSPLGEFPKETVHDNHEAWSGDHSVDYRHVPGVLLSNREITLDDPALYDLTVAILDEFGIAKTPEMIGQDCLGEKK